MSFLAAYYILDLGDNYSEKKNVCADSIKMQVPSIGNISMEWTLCCINYTFSPSANAAFCLFELVNRMFVRISVSNEVMQQYCLLYLFCPV